MSVKLFDSAGTDGMTDTWHGRLPEKRKRLTTFAFGNISVS